MADIEMKMTNWHGAVAGADKQQLLQEIEEYRISSQRRKQQDGGTLTQFGEYICGHRHQGEY